MKIFSCSTQMSMKFILLINVKMPTTVGILTFISIYLHDNICHSDGIPEKKIKKKWIMKKLDRQQKSMKNYPLGKE